LKAFSFGDWSVDFRSHQFPFDKLAAAGTSLNCVLLLGVSSSRGEKCKPREEEREREREEKAERAKGSAASGRKREREREKEKQRDALSLQHPLQRARCISSCTTHREESRDLTVSITSSFVVGMKADAKPG